MASRCSLRTVWLPHIIYVQGGVSLQSTYCMVTTHHLRAGWRLAAVYVLYGYHTSFTCRVASRCSLRTVWLPHIIYVQGSVSLHCQPVYVLDSKRNVRRLAQSVTCRTRPLHFYVTCMKHSPLSFYVFLFMCLLLVILSRSKSFISCIISNTNSQTPLTCIH